MKFKIARSKFLDSLKKVQNIVGSKGSMMILQNVLLEANDRQLFLTTTDLDISIRSVVPCEVEAEGSTTLPAKVLFNAVSKAAEGMIEVEVDGEDRAQIVIGLLPARHRLMQGGAEGLEEVLLHVPQQSIEIRIMEIEGPSVDVYQLRQLLDGDLLDGPVLHERQQPLAQFALGVADAAIGLAGSVHFCTPFQHAAAFCSKISRDREIVY